jgi:hypothetical protein
MTPMPSAIVLLCKLLSAPGQLALDDVCEQLGRRRVPGNAHVAMLVGLHPLRQPAVCRQLVEVRAGHRHVDAGVRGRVAVHRGAGQLDALDRQVSGTGEAVDRTTRRLVPARDPAALAGAIRELLADAHLRHAMTAASREGHAEPFTIERMVAETADLYRGFAYSP